MLKMFKGELDYDGNYNPTYYDETTGEYFTIKKEKNIMTKTELKNLVNEYVVTKNNENRVNHCQAWSQDFTINNHKVSILCSYNTNVGIYIDCIGTLYIFDYYSQTTYSHIHKFAKNKKVNRITWLYQRSDNIIEMAMYKYANTYKLTNEQFKDLEDIDYKTYIYNLI